MVVLAQRDKGGGSPLALSGTEKFGHRVMSSPWPRTTQLLSLFPGTVKHPLDGPRFSSTHARPGAAQHLHHTHQETHLAVITPLKRVSCAERCSGAVCWRPGLVFNETAAEDAIGGVGALPGLQPCSVLWH